ncbi:peroxiredoxin [Reinekea sp. G2M2-21]|uniref:peroxiredoxin family protein n=1 Tax=Reinekea sp. G2M2-21 TaxID=2788942 RepID=UPI0018AC4920|nr:redoxin domain-containing protein [Reinekea sp. G2M2-21]
MRLTAPLNAITFATKDVYGKALSLQELKGKKVILSFFRDAACPFCNFRVYEFTHKYKAWQQQGIEVIAVFSSPANEVREHVARYPRPFRLVSDPDLSIYNKYGVEKSASALWKALLFRFPRILKGIMKGGRPKPNPHVTLVPADFLINEKGQIEDTWYGRNTSDHIPLERIDAFIKG